MSNNFPRKELKMIRLAMREANYDGYSGFYVNVGDSQVLKDLMMFAKYNNMGWLREKYPIAMMLYEELVLEMGLDVQKGKRRNAVWII